MDARDSKGGRTTKPIRNQPLNHTTMRTKNLFAICIFTLLTVNLVHAGWPSVDPHAENYYPQSPYTFVGGNPVSNVELDGKDWYRNENGDMMWRRIQRCCLDKCGNNLFTPEKRRQCNLFFTRYK